MRPAGDGDLRGGVADRRAIREFGIIEHRRERQHDARNLRLVARQTKDDMPRRVRRAGERFGERSAHQRGRIVQDGRQGEDRFAPNRLREAGMQIGSRQRAGRVGALLRGSALHPRKKSTHYVRLAHDGVGRRIRGGIDGDHEQLPRERTRARTH